MLSGVGDIILATLNIKMVFKDTQVISYDFYSVFIE